MQYNKKVFLIIAISLVLIFFVTIFYEMPSDYVFDPKSGRLFWCPEGKINCEPPSWQNK